MSDAVTNRTTNTASSQQCLVTSFSSLLEKIEILVKVGDEVAKVCPLLYSSLLYRSEILEDPSLCQFCVASSLGWIQGTSDTFIPALLAHEYLFE
jgi:hypothetical protein